MINSFIRGLVKPESYNEAYFTDSELARAEDLVYEGATPLTGFELHLMKCHRGEATPATPKEAALLAILPEYGDYGEPEKNFSYQDKDYADELAKWALEHPSEYRDMKQQGERNLAAWDAAQVNAYLEAERSDLDG